jgi:hypothetical protein
MGWERRALIAGIVYNGDGVIQWIPCSATGGLRLRASLSHGQHKHRPAIRQIGGAGREDGTMSTPYWAPLVQLDDGVVY